MGHMELSTEQKEQREEGKLNLEEKNYRCLHKKEERKKVPEGRLGLGGKRDNSS